MPNAAKMPLLIARRAFATRADEKTFLDYGFATMTRVPPNMQGRAPGKKNATHLGSGCLLKKNSVISTEHGASDIELLGSAEPLKLERCRSLCPMSSI